MDVVTTGESSTCIDFGETFRYLMVLSKTLVFSAFENVLLRVLAYFTFGRRDMSAMMMEGLVTPFRGIGSLDVCVFDFLPKRSVPSCGRCG